jgi:peptidyl-prolyl cis-trans isomerase SurA
VLAVCASLSLAQPTSPGIQIPGAGGPRPGAAPAQRPAAAPAQRPAGSTVPLDRVIAVVNDEALTQFELDEMKRIVLAQMKASNVRPPARDALDNQVLERLIIDRALQQFAKDNGVRVDDQMVERTILRIAHSWPEERRRSSGKISAYREDIRARSHHRACASKVDTAQADAEDHLTMIAAQAGGEAICCWRIMVAVPEQATSSGCAAAAEDALQRSRAARVQPIAADTGSCRMVQG